MKVKLDPQADEELSEAVAYFEAKQPGLGIRFYEEVFHTLDWIAVNAMLPRLRDGFRRVNLPVFSYYIAYHVEPELIYVAAVAHAHRQPGYWRGRLRKGH